MIHTEFTCGLANRADPIRLLLEEQSDLGLHCLLTRCCLNIKGPFIYGDYELLIAAAAVHLLVSAETIILDLSLTSSESLFGCFIKFFYKMSRASYN